MRISIRGEPQRRKGRKGEKLRDQPEFEALGSDPQFFPFAPFAPLRFTQFSRGFTLMELIVVLILFAVAAAVVMPSFTSGLKGLELETAGRNLITQMKHARSQAIGKQKVFRIILQEKSYIFANDFGEEIKSFSFPEGVALETGNEPPMTISFYANGRSTGATFDLKNQAGKKMAILVDPITGFAFVRDPKETKQTKQTK